MKFLSLFCALLMTQALAYSQDCTLTIENSDIRVPIELITDQYVFNDYFRCVSTWTPNQTSVDAGQSVFLVYQNLLNNERGTPVRFQTFYIGTFFSVSSYTKTSDTEFEITGHLYVNGDCQIHDAICKLTIDVTDVINHEKALIELGDEENTLRRIDSNTTHEIDASNSHISINVKVTRRWNDETGEWN